MAAHQRVFRNQLLHSGVHLDAARPNLGCDCTVLREAIFGAGVLAKLNVHAGNRVKQLERSDTTIVGLATRTG